MRNNKTLEIYVWAHPVGGLRGSWHYAMVYNNSFVGGGSTPTITTSKDYWKEARDNIKKTLEKKGLEEISLYDGIVPPFEDWEEDKNLAKPIPILEHNSFLLNFDVNNLHAD